ncbi:MAG TPA: pyrroline-5-carboxylate reductase [Candidatus Methanoperedens sp.]|nr:pyrroline-5-carboxylate reductase [Candidatus Methanoperedens sp.]
MASRMIGVIGAGNMGEALIRGLVGGKVVRPSDLWVSEPDAARRARLVKGYRVRAAAGNADLARRCGVIVLAVKPQAMADALAAIAPLAGRGKLVVSIAAGIPLVTLERTLRARLVRTMPNTPALVGEGATAIAWGRGATAADKKLVRKLFGAVGTTVEVAEGLMDAVTGLSGSGPAYIFTVIQALADGGVQAGLPRAIALQLAAQTTLGAAQMVLATGAHPHQLRDQVASPGGTTIRGIAELEERGVPGAFMAAVRAATARSKELSGK